MHGMVNVASGMGNPDYWWEYPQEDYEEFEISTPDWGFCHVETTAGDDPTMTLRRLSRGNEFVKKANEETDLFILKRYPVPPATPKGLSPNTDSDPVSTTGSIFRQRPFRILTPVTDGTSPTKATGRSLREIKLKTFRSPFRKRGAATEICGDRPTKKPRGTASTPSKTLMSPRRLLMQRFPLTISCFGG